MNENERKVLELIRVKKLVATEDICSALAISESTARRALVKLDGQNLIRRYHGGGQSLEYDLQKTNIQRRFDLRREAKDRIAQVAAERVKPGSTIILMGGTTVLKMCKYLSDARVTIITNSIPVFDEIKNRRAITSILLGGKYNHDEMEVRGVLANSNLRMLHADSVFMGTSCFHPKIGFLTDDIESIELYRLCIEAANRTYILADSSKLGERGAGVTTTCGAVKCLITDSGLAPETVEAFLAAGTDVKLV